MHPEKDDIIHQLRAHLIRSRENSDMSILRFLLAGSVVGFEAYDEEDVAIKRMGHKSTVEFIRVLG